MWMPGLVHLKDVAQPPPASLFHLDHYVVNACAPAHFFVGDALLPVDSEDSTKAPTFKAPESALNFLVGSPGL